MERGDERVPGPGAAAQLLRAVPRERPGFRAAVIGRGRAGLAAAGGGPVARRAPAGGVRRQHRATAGPQFGAGRWAALPPQRRHRGGRQRA
ncbi:hypothetical protein LA21_07965, partial [Xanthomonas oryzae pv. oryzae]